MQSLYILSPPPYLVCLLCACSDLISSLHRQWYARERRKTRGVSVGIAIAKSSTLPKAANAQHTKAANTIPKATCPSHLSTPDPETFRKVSTVEATCPYPSGPTTTEQQWQAQNATQSTPTLPTFVLIYSILSSCLTKISSVLSRILSKTLQH